MTTDNIWRWIGRALWLVFFVLCGAGYYANHYFPHGPLYDTGEVVCQNDGQTGCGEQYKEDTRNLHVPDWVKFSRTDGAFLLIFGLAFAGMIASSRPAGGYKKEDGYAPR